MAPDRWIAPRGSGLHPETWVPLGSGRGSSFPAATSRTGCRDESQLVPRARGARSPLPAAGTPAHTAPGDHQQHHGACSTFGCQQAPKLPLQASCIQPQGEKALSDSWGLQQPEGGLTCSLAGLRGEAGGSNTLASVSRPASVKSISLQRGGAGEGRRGHLLSLGGDAWPSQREWGQGQGQGQGRRPQELPPRPGPGSLACAAPGRR